jgi:hypothetical protein
MKENTYKVHSIVETLVVINRENCNIPAKSKGTILSIYNNGEAYAVEFCLNENDIKVVTVYSREIQYE